jgi:hypothetical protein
MFYSQPSSFRREFGERVGTQLHNATYGFNDDILLTRARYCAEIARPALPTV